MSRKTLSKIFYCLMPAFLALSFTAHAAAGRESIIRNGSFEEADGRGIALGWSHDARPAQVRASLDGVDRQEGATSQKLEYQGAGNLVFFQDVIFPASGEYFFSAWVKSLDRVIAEVAGTRVPYVKQGEWQRVAGLVNIGESGDGRVSFTLGGLLDARPTGFKIDGVELYPLDEFEPPARRTYPATKLASGGRPAARIVYPAGVAGGFEHAARIQGEIERITGVKVPAASCEEATGEGPPVLREEYRDSNLILLGRLGTNRAIWPSYNRWLSAVDGYYPGGDGYVVRTASNVMRNGKNHLIVGSSSDAALGRAVDKFIEALRSTSYGADGSFSLPWLLDVELGGECLEAFEEDDAAWRKTTRRPWLSQGEAGYGTVRTWYENAMGYYWSGWESYRVRAEELIEPVLSDRAYIHHYIAEFFVRAWDMVDDSGLFSEDTRREIDSYLAWNFREWQEGESRWFRLFSQPYDKVFMRSRHEIAPWMAMLVMADFLDDYFELEGELEGLVSQRRAELHGVLTHIVQERWGSSVPGASGLPHFTETANSFFRYALHNEVYEFFDSGNAGRALELENTSRLDVMRGDMRVPYGILASYYGDPGYLWLLENMRFMADDHFMGRYVNNVRRYVPGEELEPSPPVGLSGVRIAPMMEHWKNNPGLFESGSFTTPDSPGRVFASAAFREGFGEADDYFLLSGSTGKPVGREINPGALAVFSSRGLDNWFSTRGDRYFDQNAVNIVPGDVLGVEDRPYSALASLDWEADFGLSGGVSVRLDPFMGMEWTRRVVWIEPGLYVVSDVLEALREDEFSMSVNWHPRFRGSWDGKGLTVLTRWGRMRITPLSDVFWTSENSTEVSAGLETDSFLRLIASGRMKKGDSVEAATVLHTYSGSEPRYRAGLLETGDIRLESSGGALHVGWGGISRGGIYCDSAAFVAGKDYLELLSFRELSLDGRSLISSDIPLSARIDWGEDEARVYAGSGEDPVLSAHDFGRGEISALGMIIRREYVDAPAAGFSEDEPGAEAGPLQAESVENEWSESWVYKGFKRSSLVTGVRNLGDNVLDLGREVLISRIDNMPRWRGRAAIRAGLTGEMPEIWTALELGEWSRLEEEPVWQEGIRKGNYGRVDRVERSHQVVKPDVRARYVRIEGDARHIYYYDGEDLNAREPLRLELADVNNDGNLEIFAVSDVYYNRLGGNESSFAVLGLEGDEFFRHDVDSVPVMDFKLVDYTGDGAKEVILVKHGAWIKVYDAEGSLIRNVDVYSLHEKFQEKYRRPATRHPAALYHSVYTAGLWRRGACGTAKLVLPRYGQYSFVDEQGNYEGVLRAGMFVQPAILPYGIDFSGDGIEEQLAVERYRLVHLYGSREPEIRDRYWPEVYGASAVILPHSGEGLAGSRVKEFRVLSFGGGSRYVLIAAADYLAVYDGRDRKFIFEWVPVIRFRAFAVSEDTGGQLTVMAADESNALWKVSWNRDLSAPVSVNSLHLDDRVNRIRPAGEASGYVLISGNRGVYILKDFSSLSLIREGIFTDAWILPGPESKPGRVVAANRSGDVIRLDRMK